MQQMTVIGMNANRDTSNYCSNPAKRTRFCHMRMNDVGSNLSQFFNEGKEGTHIIKNRNSSPEGTDVVHLDFAVMQGEIIAFIIAYFTTEQGLLKCLAV